MISLDPSLYETVRTSWDTYGPQLLFGKRVNGAHGETDVTAQDVAQARQVAERSLGSLDNLDAAHFPQLTAMMTDLYWYCTHAFTEMMADQGATVYQYLFSYKGETS